MLEKITFMCDDNQPIELFVIMDTKVAGVNYLLVSESEDDDAECIILKEINESETEEVSYEPVMDDRELEYIGGIFQELLAEDEETDEE